MITVTPADTVIIQNGIEQYTWNGTPFFVGDYELIPDDKVKHLHKRVMAIAKWSRGKTIVRGRVVGAAKKSDNSDYIHYIEDEIDRSLWVCGSPQQILEDSKPPEHRANVRFKFFEAEKEREQNGN
jgi:hypothetical protein